MNNESKKKESILRNNEVQTIIASLYALLLVFSSVIWYFLLSILQELQVRLPQLSRIIFTIQARRL